MARQDQFVGSIAVDIRHLAVCYIETRERGLIPFVRIFMGKRDGERGYKVLVPTLGLGIDRCNPLLQVSMYVVGLPFVVDGFGHLLATPQDDGARFNDLGLAPTIGFLVRSHVAQPFDFDVAHGSTRLLCW
jgi:hypothetical protein